MFEVSDEFDAILKRVKKETEEKGRKKWRAEGREEVATKLIANNALPLSEISKYSGLTINELENIKRSMHV